MSKTDEMIAEAVETALEAQNANTSSAQKQMMVGGVLALGTAYIVRRAVNRRVRRKLRRAHLAENK